MALPSLDNPQDKGQVQEIVADIATAVFKSAKVSMESAAKAVIPSVPDMVDEVLEDLQSGSVRTFNLALDKLDKLVRKLGIDLKDYSKELANFQTKREEKLIKSEEKIQQLKEKNIVATIEKSGDIKILSQAEIRTRQDNLRALEKNIAEMEKSLEKDRKLLQEDKKLKTNAVKKKREEIALQNEAIEEKKKERDEERDVLGNRGEEQPGIFQRAREGAGNFADEYIPDQIRDVSAAFTEGLTAPFTAIKELGMGFAQMLKPLKLLKPLFTGLVGSLKKFALGLKASVIAFLPYIAIGALVIGALMALYLAFDKVKGFFDRFRSERESEFDMGPQETDMPDDVEYAKPNEFGSRMQRKTFVINHGTKDAEFIKPDDPRYDELYEKEFNKPAPKKGQVYMGDGKSAILPIDREGVMNPFELRNMEAEGFKLFPNPLLTPSDDKTSGQTQNNVIDSSSKINNVNNTYTSTGLNGAKNEALRAFNYSVSVASGEMG